MQKSYQHIFFDLDHTLWDFETNSYHTFIELYEEYFSTEQRSCIDLESLFNFYRELNYKYWEMYRLGEISKSDLRHNRFKHTLEQFGIKDEQLATILASEYVNRCPQKTALMPHSLEILAYLKEKYKVHILTNGFSDIQKVKLEKSGMNKYIDSLTASDTVGYKKPDVQIYHHALGVAKGSAQNSIMFGDELFIDVLGAKKSGIDQVYYNPSNKPHNEFPTYEIQCLSEVYRIL